MGINLKTLGKQKDWTFSLLVAYLGMESYGCTVSRLWTSDDSSTT